MNQITNRPAFEDGLDDAKQRFEVLASGHLNYGDEEIFALQALTKNDFVYKTANANPRSVQLAMINVASTGLTLNPAYGYAYLIPRDGQIVLDISFKGLIKIATDAGAILWARAECVHQNDTFVYHGPAAMPQIKADPFRERGEIIGAYCIAKTAQGDILCEVMDMAALEQVRSASTAYTKGAAGRKGPWENYFAEMCRKAVIKRARKTWPYTDQSGKLALAVDLANKAEGGYDLEPAAEDAPSVAALTGPEADKHFYTKEAKAERAQQKIERHLKAANKCSESITYIKERLAAGDAIAAANEWQLLDEWDQVALALTVEKGGTAFTAEQGQQISAAKAQLAEQVRGAADQEADRIAKETLS